MRNPLPVLSVIMLVCLAPGHAQVQQPAETQFRDWLAAFNAGNRGAYEAFLRERFPSRAPRLEADLDFLERTGGFDLRKVESVTATKAICLVQERAWERIAQAVIEVEPAPPHRIVRLGVNLVPRPADMPVPRLSLSGLASATRATRTVIYSDAAGLADRRLGTPNTIETKFRMGSMNKMFTATAVMQLVQAGKVKLDAPIGTYLAGYPNREVATKVTVHHLLTHTGGTGDIFGPQFDAHRLELKTLDDYVKLYGARGLEFEPGSRWEYSNYGFLLLGVIVERVSGQSYYDYVRDHIFKPAGMTGSASDPENAAVAGRATGYMREKGAWVPNTDTLPYRGTSAGGGYTTVRDLLRFATALTTHKLLDAAHTDLMTTGKVATPMGDKYAYGFTESVEGGVRSFGHGGGAPGMNGDLRIFPESGFVVAALANTGSGASEAVSWVSERLPNLGTS